MLCSLHVNIPNFEALVVPSISYKKYSTRNFHLLSNVTETIIAHSSLHKAVCLRLWWKSLVRYAMTFISTEYCLKRKFCKHRRDKLWANDTPWRPYGLLSYSSIPRFNYAWNVCRAQRWWHALLIHTKEQKTIRVYFTK